MCENLKGITIWILAFFSLLGGANVINATLMWFDLGPEFLFTPYLLGSLTGQIPVYLYLLLSVLITFAFLAGLAHKLVSDLSPEDKMRALYESMVRLESGHQIHQKTLQDFQDKLYSIEESLERNVELSRNQSEQGENMLRNLETGYQANQTALEDLTDRVCAIDEILRSGRVETIEQPIGGEQVTAVVEDKITPQLADIKEDLAKQLIEMENAMAQQKQIQKNAAKTISKQKTEIAGLQSKLEKLENEISQPKPVLTSQNDVKAISGIGPKTKTILKKMGIVNVGDLLIADAPAVAEKVGTAEKNVEKMQKQAQLLMVPGLSKKHVVLLAAVDVNDRKSLAEQDPIELSKKINGIFKATMEKGKVSKEDKPTIEELNSWIKFVKS